MNISIQKDRNRSYGTTSMPQIDTTICVADVTFMFRSDSFQVVAVGIEGGRAYAATEPRNEIVERTIIAKMEFGLNGNFAPSEVQSELRRIEQDDH